MRPRLAAWTRWTPPLAVICTASCALDFDRYDPVTDGAASVVDAVGAADATAARDVATVDVAATMDASAAVDAPAVTDAPAAMDAPASTLTTGLVAYYKFDETSGTACSDSSGNGHTAMLVGGGASFQPGLQNNAVTLSGAAGSYVSLPPTAADGLTSFSISVWVKVAAQATWARLWDLGTGTTTYMFVTPDTDTSSLRFAITAGGSSREQRVDVVPSFASGAWHHVALTMAAGSLGNTATMYLDAVAAGTMSTTLTPASLGTMTQAWLGQSAFATDPHLNGQLDSFRLYSRALTASEVATLFAGKE